jgi:tetratricopeptide (TPR) repeat protein
MTGASPPQEPSRVSTIPWKFWGLVAASVLPNIVWSAVDKTPWPWDQAWYGKHSVELFFTLIHAPSEWLAAMLNSFGRQAPGIAWMGQFFVPIGVAIGSIDAALLLSIVAAQTAALLLVARAVWDLSGHRLSAAATAVVFMASAPLFIALSHYYLVETMQATAVAWFVFIMARAPSWSRLLIVSQLVLATSFAMLAKVSSPLFCFGPGLVALYYAVWPARRGAPADRTAAAVTLAIAIPIGIATVAWYYRNAPAVMAHVSMASSGPVAELYGKAESLLPSLRFWLSAAGVNFFSWPTMVLSIATVCAGILSALASRDTSPRTFLAAAVVASIQIAVTLVTFSLNSNRDDRYLLPLVPYFAVVLCWALVQLNRKLVTAVVVAVFALQWAHTHAQSLGWIPRAESSPRWLHAAMRDAGNRTIIDSIVARTCADTTPGFYWNALGVQLMWLNPPGLSYAATKKLAPLHQLRCDYDAIAYFDGNEAEAWHRLMTKNIRYYVALESSAYALPATDAIKTVNQLNGPILDRIERSGVFQLEAGIPEHNGILVFKRVDRVDHVVNGRALSDHGKHELAVDELRKATELDPTNVEAWANLALALERRGNMSQAIAAGTEARRLQPTHYYVHMGLARAFSQQRLWTEAIASAEEAARHAPSVPERVSALALAAQGAIAAGEPAKGCGLLKTAGDLQHSGAIQEQLTRLRCAQ